MIDNEGVLLRGSLLIPSPGKNDGLTPAYFVFPSWIVLFVFLRKCLLNGEGYTAIRVMRVYDVGVTTMKVRLRRTEIGAGSRKDCFGVHYSRVCSRVPSGAQ